MKKIRAAVVGYGNIGKYVVEALEAASDFEVAGIVRRASSVATAEEMKYPVVSSLEQLERVDVAVLCTPSRLVEQSAEKALKLGISTVDSFDIHSGIADMRARLDAIARESGAAALISAGWDPGSDSVVRALLEVCAPQGITYTNFGPGMSMGHTVAVKAIEGVKAALSMTIPVGTGIHRRMVYIELEDGYDFDSVAAAIKSDAYFVNDETHVIKVESVDALKDMGHGVNMVRKGVSGKTQNQRFEFNMSIDNPGLTSQILVAGARAVLRQKPGAYTMIEVPIIDFLPGDRDQIIRRLV
ncbi:MAG: diaminopimelate dehydrogenase [Alistipes sp.]|nr:diaminopimelate dehydrogenase [Alistipes sp.]